MKFLRELLVGYVPYSLTFEYPGDRRRFCYYASKRNIRFEIAKPSQAYDVVVLTQAADISFWSQYPRGRTKIVFDFIDSYLSVPTLSPKNLLRGVAKFATRQNQRLLLNYTRGLREMCRRADATVCSTEEQRQAVLHFCPNTHVILDVHGTAVRECKSDYAVDDVFHFVWEGLPGNFRHLLEIREVLESLRRKCPFMIHAITDLQYGRYLHGQFAKRNTLNDARKLSPHIRLYAWHERTLSAIVRSCDLALIPIPLQDPICAGKPENKLLLFWRIGMPVLASATAAYSRAMKRSGLAMACATREDWQAALEYYTSHEDARKQAGQRGKAFAEEEYSEESTLLLWDEVFRSLHGESNVEGAQMTSLHTWS